MFQACFPNSSARAAASRTNDPRPLRRAAACARGASALLLSALLLVSALLVAPALALPGDIATKYKVNNADPVASIPTPEQRNANPIEFAHFLQDLIARGEGAFREGNWQHAVKYYEALAIAVPDRAISFSRLCTSYGKLGQVDVAAANCGKALTLSGARVMDHIRFAELTLQKQELSTKDVSDIEASLVHLRDHVAKNPQPPSPWDEQASNQVKGAPQPPKARTADPELAKERLLKNHVALQLKQPGKLRGATQETKQQAGSETVVHVPTEIEVLTCKLAVRLNDAERLSKCMEALRGFKLDERLLFPFAWSRALIDKDAGSAAALLEQAPGLGVSEATMAAMTAEQEKVFLDARILGLTKRWGLIVIALLVAAGAAVALARVMRRRWRNAAATGQA